MNNNILNKRIRFSNDKGLESVWKYEDYVDVLQYIQDNNALLLGGDILTLDNDDACYTSCGWYYNDGCIAESISKADEYLNSLKKWAQKEQLYVNFIVNLKNIFRFMTDVLDKRLDFSGQGFTEAVWVYSDYLKVLEYMLNNKILLQGGRILTYGNETVKATCSSWQYDGKSVEDSINHAKQYLNSLNEWSKKENLYIKFFMY